VIWDNVRYHHSRLVRSEAARLGIELRFLPPYSPDLMPVERLWSWLRQELTYLHCHHSEQPLAERIAAFVAELLDDPATVHKRLCPKTIPQPPKKNSCGFDSGRGLGRVTLLRRHARRVHGNSERTEGSPAPKRDTPGRYATHR